MYIELIWRNSQKKFKLTPINYTWEIFQDLKMSNEDFLYSIGLKAYPNNVTKTIFLNLWKKNIVKPKRIHGTKVFKKFEFSFLEFKTGSIRLDMNSKIDKSEKWKIEKIVQTKANFQPSKILKVNKESIISTKKKILKKINILSYNKKINLYCFTLKIIFV